MSDKEELNILRENVLEFNQMIDEIHEKCDQYKAEIYEKDVLNKKIKSELAIKDRVLNRFKKKEQNVAGISLKKELEAKKSVISKLDSSVKDLKSKIVDMEKREEAIFPTEKGRVIPIKTQGGHHSIWGNYITTLNDISDKKAKALISTLMKHKMIKEIMLGNYDEAKRNSKGTPKVKFSKIDYGKGMLYGTLYARGKRGNSCKVFVVVENNHESNVYDYAVYKGLCSS